MKEWGQWFTHPACYLVNCTKEIRQQSQFLRKEDWRDVSSELRVCLESTDASTKQRRWKGLSRVWQCRLLLQRRTKGTLQSCNRAPPELCFHQRSYSCRVIYNANYYLSPQNTYSLCAFNHVFISTDGAEVLPGDSLVSAQLWFSLASRAAECSRLSWQRCQ